MQLSQNVAIFISILAVAITLHNWRYGLLVVIPVGVLQDVLRKLTPGVPAYFILWSAVIFTIVMIRAYTSTPFKMQLLWFDDVQLKKAFKVFFLLILLQSAHAFIQWGHLAIPVFGVLFYLGPIAALLVVISYAQHPIWIRRFINIYLWVMVPACLTVYLSWWSKAGYPILKDIGAFSGQRLMIYDVGTILYSYCGVFRVGEIAAFHSAICAAFLTMLILEKKQVFLKKIGMSVLIALLVGAIILTGRRKMLMALSIFWVVQVFLLWVFSKGRSNGAISLLILGLIVSFGIGQLDKGASSPYLERGSSVFASVDDRASTAVSLFFSAIKRSGGVGLGAGVAAQGSRYAGIDTSRSVGGASESGIGLIAVELGIPGILIIAWLLYNLYRAFWVKLHFILSVHDDLFLYAVSFIALLVANLGTFIVATQLYGDYFVLIILGMIAGMLYATIYHAAILRKAMLKNH